MNVYLLIFLSLALVALLSAIFFLAMTRPDILSAFIPFFKEPVPNIVWQKTLGGSGDDWAWSVQQTRDGGYIVAGYTESNDGDVSGNHGGKDFWVVKLDKSGNIEWQKTLGGSGEDEAISVQQTKDGGYVVAGYTWSNDGDVSGNHGSADFWVVKLGW